MSIDIKNVNSGMQRSLPDNGNGWSDFSKLKVKCVKIKAYLLIMLIALVTVFAAGCNDERPDLVVTTFEVTRPAFINPENSVVVPIQLIIKNQGNAAADIFKVSTEYTGSSGTFVVPFVVGNTTDIWYPYTNASLNSNSTVTFTGSVIFPPSKHGETVTLIAIADSCSGDEFMPDYCRVEESNEDNNKAAAISVSLP